jgi:hypothetical protein
MASARPRRLQPNRLSGARLGPRAYKVLKRRSGVRNSTTPTSSFMNGLWGSPCLPTVPRLVIPASPSQTSRDLAALTQQSSPRVSLRHHRLDGLAVIAGDQCDHGVEGGFERLGVTLDLSQQQAALQGGEGGEGELVGIGLGGEPAELMHLP